MLHIFLREGFESTDATESASNDELWLPSRAFSSGVSEALIPADILKVRFLLGGGQQISLSKLAKA
jgi:hypothetical protein